MHTSSTSLEKKISECMRKSHVCRALFAWEYRVWISVMGFTSLYGGIFGVLSDVWSVCTI